MRSNKKGCEPASSFFKNTYLIASCIKVSASVKSASAVVSNSKIIVPLAGLIDLNEEIKRQNKKLEKLLAEKNSLLARTNNEKFMSNAKPELIEQTKNRIEELTVQENAINELIESLKD